MQILCKNARIVDATLPEPREGHVLVEDGIIRDLEARPLAAPDRLVLDLRGRTLMPGLIDCHVHVVASMMNLGANAQLPEATAVLRSLPLMKGMLDRGFTTVRDAGGAPAALAQAVADGLAVGPRRSSYISMTRPRTIGTTATAGVAISAPLPASPTASMRSAVPAARNCARARGSSRSWPMAGWPA